MHLIVWITSSLALKAGLTSYVPQQTHTTTTSSLIPKLAPFSFLGDGPFSTSPLLSWHDLSPSIKHPEYVCLKLNQDSLGQQFVYLWSFTHNSWAFFLPCACLAGEPRGRCDPPERRAEKGTQGPRGRCQAQGEQRLCKRPRHWEGGCLEKIVCRLWGWGWRKETNKQTNEIGVFGSSRAPAVSRGPPNEHLFGMLPRAQAAGPTGGPERQWWRRRGELE